MKRAIHICTKNEIPYYGILRTPETCEAIRENIETALYNVNYDLYNGFELNEKEVALLDRYRISF